MERKVDVKAEPAEPAPVKPEGRPAAVDEEMPDAAPVPAAGAVKLEVEPETEEARLKREKHLKKALKREKREKKLLKKERKEKKRLEAEAAAGGAAGGLPAAPGAEAAAAAPGSESDLEALRKKALEAAGKA